MIFTEYRFALFFGLVFCVYWALRGNRRRKLFLLLSSYLFYSLWDWRFLSLLLLSTGVDHLAARGIGVSSRSAVRRRWLALSISVNLGLLGVFKYLGFFLDSTAELLEGLGFEVSLPALEIVLPVGISFYTFQTLSYTLDVYRGRERAAQSLLDVALFVGFFPQLVAGPIVRSRELLPQLHEERRWARVPVRAMLWLFLIGFFKKACVSDNIHLLVDAYYANVPLYTGESGILASMWFSVQLYCDFSGYSDMAIACAGLLGFQLPQNFYFPLLAEDYTKLMNRWHMSLSRWVRDYVYVPLVGERSSVGYQMSCLMGAMLLVGLWHGAGWTFLVWGFGMGLGALVHRLWHVSPWSARWRGRRWKFLGFLLTYSWLVSMLVLFRAETLSRAWLVLRSIAGLAPTGGASFGGAAWLVLLVIALVHLGFFRFRPERLIQRMPSWAFSVLMGVLVPLSLGFARADVRPFVYFQF